VGVGKDCSIRELAETIGAVVAYKGRIEFDSSKPDGTPRKLLDTARMSNLGWRSSIRMVDGLQTTYEWFLANETKLRGGRRSQADRPKLRTVKRTATKAAPTRPQPAWR
jgi:GDP-L-fucose synthase